MIVSDGESEGEPVALERANAAAPSEPATENFWALFGRGATKSGRAVARAATVVAHSVSGAYLAVDADLRRHVAHLPLMGLTLLAKRQRGVEAIADDGYRPIVFIHGVAGNPGNFLPMRKFLAMRGRRRTYAIALSASGIRENAEHLSRFIEEVVRVNDLPPGATVDCVGHSMGGLVARLAIEDPATRDRIATLVTLGTPHTGTYAARFGATQNVLDLRPGSSVLDQLHAQLPWRGPPHQPSLVSLWSQADVLLLPAEAAIATGAAAIEMPGFTHYSYVLHPLSWSRVLEILAPDWLASPGLTREVCQ